MLLKDDELVFLFFRFIFAYFCEEDFLIDDDLYDSVLLLMLVYIVNILLLLIFGSFLIFDVIVFEVKYLWGMI